MLRSTDICCSSNYIGATPHGLLGHPLGREDAPRTGWMRCSRCLARAEATRASLSAGGETNGILRAAGIRYPRPKRRESVRPTRVGVDHNAAIASRLWLMFRHTRGGRPLAATARKSAPAFTPRTWG